MLYVFFSTQKFWQRKPVEITSKHGKIYIFWIFFRKKKLFSSLTAFALSFFMMWNLFLWHHLYSDVAIVSGKCYQFLHRTQQHSNSTINASWNKDFFSLIHFCFVCVLEGVYLSRRNCVDIFLLWNNFWKILNNKNSFLLIWKKWKNVYSLPKITLQLFLVRFFFIP